jgi:hypothetical protein
MLRKVSFLLVFILIASTACAQQLKIDITAPLDKADVPERPIIEGTVSDSSAKVWVIVHPMEVGDYWVQPRITVEKNGTWRVMAYTGRPGNLDIGKYFEIMAVANPKAALKEGAILAGWPEAQEVSKSIVVKRK